MSTTQQEVIPRDLTISALFEKFPGKSQRLAQELTNAGLHCVGCGAATYETLENGMRGHGFDEEKIDKLMGRLNAIVAEEEDLSTIRMTPVAAQKFLHFLEVEEKQGWGLRFEEKKGGCGGFEYVLDYSEKAGDEDQIFLSHGIEIHVKEEMVDRLLGSVIDYVDGLRGGGFKVLNPNVTKSCGCGNSHNYRSKAK